MGLWDRPLSPEEREVRDKAVREYERPAPPAQYAARPSPLGDEDREWLKTVDDQLWRTTAPDRFGHRHRVEHDGVSLSQDELDRLFRLIRDHHLVTSMGSGVFGFGYSIGVYEEPEPPALGIEMKPEYLVCVTEHHLPHPDGLLAWPAGTHDKQKELAWGLFSQFTHSPHNAEMLQRNKMDPPRRRGDIDY